jgi:hypothetical protein
MVVVSQAGRRKVANVPVDTRPPWEAGCPRDRTMFHYVPTDRSDPMQR